MSSNLSSYPITEDWPYSSGGRSSYNIFGSEPPSSDPAFELYAEQEGHSDASQDLTAFDEPPSSDWDYFEQDPDEVEKAILGDMLVEESDFGEVDPFTDEEYLDLFGELPLELNRISSDDCSSVSSRGSGGAEGELITEQDDVEMQAGANEINQEFCPNRPAALRADMAVFNEFWTNPLEDSNGVLQPMPPPLQALKLGDLPYICRIMVHTNFAFSRSSNLQFVHLDGTVSIYHSRHALSRHDGLQQLLVGGNVDSASIERIMDAWNWLTEHNPVYRDEDDIEEEQLPEASLEVREEEMVQANISFPWSVLAAAEAGPRAGDVEVQNLQVGTDRRGRAQYFQDPDLMLKAFPELFPFALDSSASSMTGSPRMLHMDTLCERQLRDVDNVQQLALMSFE
ncbi:hypothetical protein BG000_002107 [Podila horticola]|nr:hypothetical protein BG000_002107 [Podila horticola]